MLTESQNISLAGFAAALAVLIGGILWAYNDFRSAELVWGIGLIAAAIGFWKWRALRSRSRGNKY
jgi:hypothetical protein